MILTYIAYFVLALILHEVGHCIAAYACRVKVTEFGLGWGPQVYIFRFRKVTYGIRVLPLGAYVRLDLPGLLRRPLLQQIIVLLAGIAANLIAATLTEGSRFSLMNYLLAATNILPLYQQDSWKCGVVILRDVLHRKSPLVEWTFTIAGAGLSLILFIALIIRRANGV
ncbi:MAG TPA: site-2 protease family protein [Pyrinomonadaceae bacterium]|jgi:Predicted membrane-associated Zn-dependent proteases 1|nr:site-2 protease family protein [Pyrinomonadaceae bacterium]